jgi:2,3-bisphosphoglycerate-dependent phosphoglycerate mutase
MKAQQTVSVVLIRHGQSEWNNRGRFTGWADPLLTEQGEREALKAGAQLRAAGYRFDAAFSSCLQRTQRTLDILLQQLAQEHIPRYRDWRLNERHLGVLQGMDKQQATERYGAEQLEPWRRGVHDRPPPLAMTDVRHPAHNAIYAAIDPSVLPATESLADTAARVAGFWQECISPRLSAGESLLICSHQQALRALLAALSGHDRAALASFDIPTATPMHCQFSLTGQLMGRHYLHPEHGR